MDLELKQLIETQQKKIDDMYITMKKIQKYMQWTLITTVILFILPLVIILIAAPIVFNNYISMISGLNL